jgi:hypothetical protein
MKIDRARSAFARFHTGKARVPTSFAESVWNFFILLTLTVEQIAACSGASDRTVVFMCKPTPSEDEFALWLEATGYNVFADARTLEPGVAGVSS